MSMKNYNYSPNWIAWFIGFIDGDGYLGLTKNRQFIKWELSINLNFRDLKLLQQIKENLGIGHIRFITSAKNPTVRYTISSKEEIIKNLFPLINDVPLLTNHRYWQFHRAKIAAEQNIV
jgi:hypothetical protein